MLNINCVFEGIIPKKQESIDDCQDRYWMKDNCLAIADGASQSFYPSIWAELLVQYFCDNPKLDEENWEQWLLPIQEKWRSEVTQRVEVAKNERKPVWVTNQNRLLRREAATSTFVGLELMNEKLRLSVVGDSCFFIWQKHQNKLDTYILRSSQEFDDRPEYFGSYPKDNKFAPKCQEIDLKHQDIKSTFFFLATDALAEWILKNWEQKEDIFSYLLEISSFEEFKNAMSQARENSEFNLKNDDTTLITFQISKDKISQKSLSSISPALPKINKFNNTSIKQKAIERNANKTIEEEKDLSENTEIDTTTENQNINLINTIQKLFNKTTYFLNKEKSHESSINNDRDQSQIPDNSTQPLKDIYQLQKEKIHLGNKNQKLISKNKKLRLHNRILSILFASSLLGCIVLTFFLLKSRPSELSSETTDHNTEKPQTKSATTINPPEQEVQTKAATTTNPPEQEAQTKATTTTNPPEQKAQITPGKPLNIPKEKKIYDDYDSSKVIIKSLSNPIEFTVEELETNLVKVQASFFIEKNSQGDCSGCDSNEINVKKGSSIWKNTNGVPENKVGILVDEKRFLTNPGKGNEDFISIQFSGYIKKD